MNQNPNSKLLTIVIPSYNVEKTLQETVSSMLKARGLERMEILIVDDGSKDGTAQIGRRLEQQHPECVRYVHKENGGHGSTINTGIAQARGNYFKVVDGDDWVCPEALSDLLDLLEHCEADFVASPFYLVDDRTKERTLQDSITDRVPVGQLFCFDEVCDRLQLEMHALTMRTKLLRDHGIHLDEHCFYVDAEYILMPIPFVQTLWVSREPLYLYRVFSDTQSMSTENMQKNCSHHEKVTLHMAQYYEQNKNRISAPKADYIARRVIKLIEMQYQIYFSFPYSKTIERRISRFNHDLQAVSPELYDRSMGHTVRWVRKNVPLFYPLAKLREKLR